MNVLTNTLKKVKPVNLVIILVKNVVEVTTINVQNVLTLIKILFLKIINAVNQNFIKIISKSLNIYIKKKKKECQEGRYMNLNTKNCDLPIEM